MSNVLIKKETLSLLLIILLAGILRLWQLGKVPVSLFGDELDVGYQALSVLTTGRDYTGHFLPIHFRSLSEWRTPVYLFIPTVAIFGLSEWGVRLPAALFGIAGVIIIFYLIRLATANISLALLTSLMLAISPWHIHFSRAGFEVTPMLFFYLLALFIFLKALKNNKLLPLASLVLGITLWGYSTSKLFLPIFTLALVVIWWRQIKQIKRVILLVTLAIFILIVLPFYWNTFGGSGTERIEGISLFNDPTIIPRIGFDRLKDTQVLSDSPLTTLTKKVFHNQPLSFSSLFFQNYFRAYSTDFLFLNGDPNPRQSSGMGEFYKVEALLIALGLVSFFTARIDKRFKVFILVWLLTAPIPSALTKDGGTHATRLILMLPPLTLLSASGLYGLYQVLHKPLREIVVGIVVTILLLNFLIYQHNFWVHYPWQSEKWWQAGFKEMVKEVLAHSQDYQKIIISDADEPALIFFLAWSKYPPALFQQKNPLSKETLQGFGEVARLDKYYFTQVGQDVGIYNLGKVLPKGTLYVATDKEVKFNLLKEPGRLPEDLTIIKTVIYPSGNPAFYLLTKNEK